MKLKAWMIYLLGLGIITGASQAIKDPIMIGNVIGSYFFYGGAFLLGYYIIRNFWKKKQEVKKLT